MNYKHTAMLLLQYPFIFLYLCFSTPFLPQPFFKLYILLCLIWNLHYSVNKSFSLCLSSETSLLYIHWEELIQLSPNYMSRVCKSVFTDKLESTPTGINTRHSLFLLLSAVHDDYPVLLQHQLLPEGPVCSAIPNIQSLNGDCYCLLFYIEVPIIPLRT